MKKRVFLAIAVIFSAINPGFSSMCVKAKAETFSAANGKCAVRKFSDAFQNSKAVFLGEVISEKKNGDYKTFKFKVEKYWKGTNVKTIEVSVYETMRYQAFYKIGEKYLVYARTGENGKFLDGRCSRSQSVENASDDITKLGKARKPK